MEDVEAEAVEKLFCKAGWDETCRTITKEMCAHVAPFSTPIAISLNNETVGKQLGTGSYHDLFGRKLILSCEHVLSYAKTNFLAHRLLGRERLVRVAGFHAEAPHPVDAAIVTVEPLAWEELAGDSRAVTQDRFAPFHAPTPYELLFTRGYASENSQFVHDTLTTGATGYLARQASLPQHSDVIEQFHFALEYRRDAAVQAFGERGLPDPESMSGSLVWNTRFVEVSLQGKAWTPADAVVTGLLWSWPDESRIVATRIEYVRSFLLDAAHVLYQTQTLVERAGVEPAAHPEPPAK